MVRWNGGWLASPFPSLFSPQIHPHVVRIGQKAFSRPERLLPVLTDRKGRKRGNHVVLVPRIRALRAQGKELLERHGAVPMIDPHVGVEARGEAVLLFVNVCFWWW